MSPADAPISRDREIMSLSRSMTVAQISERLKMSKSGVRHLLKKADIKAVPAVRTARGKLSTRRPKSIPANFDEEIRDRNRRLKSNELLAAALRREIAASQGGPDA